MREWNLKTGDPLLLTLAADARLGGTDYCDDQIWELKLGGGEPPALALQTTYGLRARALRLFPRFAEGDGIITDPADFARPVVLRRFYPNYLRLHFSPLPNIDVEAEYWVPQSKAIAGRFQLENTSSTPRQVYLIWVAQLSPTEGQRMAPAEIQAASLLLGQTEHLAPVVFISGGARPVSSPYPALILEIDLPPGERYTAIWAHAALTEAEASFQVARQTVARNWEAEIARVELLSASQVEIHTGDPDWDAALAFSQKAAYAAFIGPTGHLPAPSFVLSRQPDHGYSLRGDGSDYQHLWSGQTPLEAYYLSGLLLPGGADLLKGVIRNFLATQNEQGEVDWKPGLAGQRSHLMSTPVLASLAWRIFQITQDKRFLEEVFPKLLDFVHAWFALEHDRDGDGVPEWDHPMQAGLEDHPLFSHWHPWSQGVDISTVESPALCAFLYRECHSLIQMSQVLGHAQPRTSLQTLAEHLRRALEAAWDKERCLYPYWDRDSHQVPKGELLGQRFGPGEVLIQRDFPRPARLLVQITAGEQATTHPTLFLYGTGVSGQPRVERLSGEGFRWHLGQGTLTGERIYSHLERVLVQDIGEKDHIRLFSVGLDCADATLFLPLWAGMLTPERADLLVRAHLMPSSPFYRPFGIPACPEPPLDDGAGVCYGVSPLWNALIGEGLLAYGYQQQAADLVSRLMAAIIQNLKQHGAFFHQYHADSGQGLGERNVVSALAPVGLFLEALGVRIYSARRVFLHGTNPFPWPVTVKFQGLSLFRRQESTVISFPDGHSVTIADPRPQTVLLEGQ